MKTADLLKLTPANALVAMVNWENGTSFQPDTFLVSAPSVIDNNGTNVTISIRPPASLTDHVPAPGSFGFNFQRLNLNDTFKDVLSGFRPNLPTSTKVLLDELSARSGIEFYAGEFEEDYIDRENASPYRLRAAPDSLRWVGYTDIVIAEYTDLAVYLQDATPAPFNVVDETIQLAVPAIAYGYLNGTPSMAAIKALGSDPTALVNIFNSVVGGSALYPSGVNTPWVYQPTPAPYNLYGAVVVSKNAPATADSTAVLKNPNLNKALVVDLNLAYCTNFKFSRIEIPYLDDWTTLTNFTNRPRFKQSGPSSISDGSAVADYISRYTTGQIINAVPNGGLNLSGDVLWVSDPARPSRTNLYNAVVQYCGARRTSDSIPANTTLDQVLVLTMDETYNTAYTGNITFHYKGPVFINKTPPDAQFNVPYNYDMAPNGYPGSYSFAVISGAMPTGLVITNGIINGTPTSMGMHYWVLEITTATGGKARYNMQMRVINPG